MDDSSGAPTRVGGTNAGHLAIMRDLDWLGSIAFAGSLVCALGFGLWFLRRPASPLRTIVKSGAVTLLALACFLGSGPQEFRIGSAPAVLLAGLALSALGDAFLAVESDRRLRLGLVCFLAAHVAYVVLFLFFAPPMDDPHWSRAEIEPSRYVVMVAAALAALGMLAWLWPRLGAMKAPVSLYVAAIVGMVVASQTLPPEYTAPPAGALLFFASDAILAAQLFRGVLRNWIGDSLIWWLYYVGQVAIMIDFAGHMTF